MGTYIWTGKHFSNMGLGFAAQKRHTDGFSFHSRPPGISLQSILIVGIVLINVIQKRKSERRVFSNINFEIF